MPDLRGKTMASNESTPIFDATWVERKFSADVESDLAAFTALGKFANPAGKREPARSEL
jgi:hypothetical protein